MICSVDSLRSLGDGTEDSMTIPYGEGACAGRILKMSSSSIGGLPWCRLNSDGDFGTEESLVSDSGIGGERASTALPALS
ncbi:UNVERIFIED_CONTAM: hypothetical protein K2H54_057626 [Gekko kuhli]